MELRKPALLAASLGGAWAAYNGFLYAADMSRRYRVESAWFAFAVLLILIAADSIARADKSPQRVATTERRVVSLSAIGFLAAALLLYFPMLSIGLLSDDFTLLSRAQTGSLTDPVWEFLRPLPLALWKILGAPAALHSLNILLHGLNSWLTSVLADRAGMSRTEALLAGAVFLFFPLSVEAVAWAAGIFDVLLVALVLSACIGLTTIADRTSRTIAVALLTIAALLTKETAVVMPAILAITAAVAPVTSVRANAVPIAVSFGIAALYIPVRMMAGFEAAPSATFSGYAMKEFLSRPFGALALPFHVELLRSQPWIVFVSALTWPVLLALSAMRWAKHSIDASQVIGSAAWILVSVLPLGTMLFIAGDLENARYLYLGTAALSMMLIVVLRPIKRAQPFVIGVTIALCAFAVRSHQSHWIAAAHERDRVLAAYRDSGIGCVPDTVDDLPDNVGGAYVFRNGFTDAALAISPTNTNLPCALKWDGERFTRVR